MIVRGSVRASAIVVRNVTRDGYTQLLLDLELIPMYDLRFEAVEAALHMGVVVRKVDPPRCTDAT